MTRRGNIPVRKAPGATSKKPRSWSHPGKPKRNRSKSERHALDVSKKRAIECQVPASTLPGGCHPTARATRAGARARRDPVPAGLRLPMVPTRRRRRLRATPALSPTPTLRRDTRPTPRHPPDAATPALRRDTRPAPRHSPGAATPDCHREHAILTGTAIPGEANTAPMSNPDHRPRHPLRRLRHAAVAGLARELPEAALAADCPSARLMQDTVLRAQRPGLRAADRGLQPGAPLPDRRATARRRHRRRPHRAGAGGPQQRPRHRRRRPAGGRGRPGRRAVDDGRRRMPSPTPTRCTDALRHRRGGGAGRPDRHLRHAADRAGNRLRLYRASAIRCATRPACTPSPASWKSRTPRPPRAWSPAAGICGTPACSCSPPAPCCRRWKPTRRRCCRRCARRSPARRTDLDFIRLDEAAFTRLPVDQPGLRGGRADRGRPPWCRPISAGPTWAAGARCGNWARNDAAGNVAVGDVVLENVAELLRAQRRHADRGGRAEGRRGGGDQGCRCWRCTATTRRT